MARSLIRIGIPVLGSILVSFVVFACSSEGTKSSSGADDAGTGGASTGGGSSSGGSSSGGSTGSGGAGTGGSTPVDAGDPYTCYAKDPVDPGGTDAEGSGCCELEVAGATTKFGVCTKTADITDPLQKSSFGYDSCDKGADLKCAPTSDALADAGSLGVFASCTWKVGTQDLEGRCLPKCFIVGNPASGQLVQSDCSDPNLLCAPCYNPIDGSSTGACSFKAGDAAVDPAPTQFAECGSSVDGGPTGGLCVPKALADASGNPAAASLVQLDCASADEVCAPTLKVADINACFDKCAVNATVAGLVGSDEGGCVPAFVVKVVVGDIGVSTLTQESCAAGELCSPCLNPLSMPANQPSGACD